MLVGVSGADKGCPEPRGAAGSQGLFKSDVPFSTHWALRGTSVCPSETPVNGKQILGRGSS